VPARHEARERTSEIVRRRLPDERPSAGSGLHNAEKLERTESFANRRTRHLKLLRELSLRRKLVARAEVALLEKSLDLLDNALVKAASADRLDDGQGLTSPEITSGQVVRPDVPAAYGGSVTAVNLRVRG